MPVTVTSTPEAAMPGQVVGAPIRLPYVLLCTQGERWCGKHWTANSRPALAELMAERRKHENGCMGGLIVAGA
jgi:hypothetical protein